MGYWRDERQRDILCNRTIQSPFVLIKDQRRGKIARFPRPIHDELNVRLDDGQDANQILPWLNGLHEVREALPRHFNGAPISKQNLSAWRQGGFKPQKPKPTEQVQERAKNKAANRASSLESQSKPVKAGQGSPANRAESLKSTEPPIVEYVAAETVTQTDPRHPSRPKRTIQPKSSMKRL